MGVFTDRGILKEIWGCKRELHITQPTLSRQLIQMEEELGVKLFHRGKHNILLTEESMLLRRRE